MRPNMNERSTSFLAGLKHFHILLNEESKEILESCVGDSDKCQLTYNFIIFNYTGLFEKILRCSIPENSDDLEHIKIGAKLYPCKFQVYRICTWKFIIAAVNFWCK